MRFFKIFYITVPMILGVIVLSSCEQVELRDHLENDNVAPGIVTDIEIENLPGGAKISYTLPEDKDILYVVADYEIRKGVTYDVKSSYYNNSVTILGFGATDEYLVDLYTVDKSGNKSQKNTITVNPLPPPIQLAFKDLTYETGFGGIHVMYPNEAKADLVTNVLIKNSEDEWVDYDRYYSNLPTGNFNVRGLPAMSTIFGVFFHDRWDNKSDTLIKEITPLFEAELDSRKFREESLEGDAPNQWVLSLMWNGNPTDNGGFSGKEAFPKHFQINLGVKSKLSRFKLWGVNNLDRMYTAGNLKEFEVWGSNNPSGDGSFDSWELLASYTVVKPSGLRIGEFTSVDKETALAGLDFDISSDAPAVKYIRINILSTFASPRNAALGDAWVREMKFWGQEQP